MKRKKMGAISDALYMVGFGNAFPGNIEEPTVRENVDEIIDDETDDETSNDLDDDLDGSDPDGSVDDDDVDADATAQQAIAEAKAQVAADIQELESDGITEALGDDDDTDGIDDADDNDSPADAAANTADADTATNDADTTDTADQAPGKGGIIMSNTKLVGVRLDFLDSIRDYVWEAVNEGHLAPELADFTAVLLLAYPDRFEDGDITDPIKAVLEAKPAILSEILAWGQKYQAENTLPEYGWRYKAVGILGGKIYDSKKAAEKAAADFIKLGHQFSELFVKDMYYKKDGKFTTRIPDGSRHRELILEKEKQASTPSDRG